MAGQRRAPRSTVHRRSTWAAAAAVPALLLAGAGAYAASPPQPATASEPGAELLSDSGAIHDAVGDAVGDAVASDAATSDSGAQDGSTATSGTPAPDSAAAAPARAAAEPTTDAPQTPARPSGLPSDVRQGGIPDINFTAYKHAAELLAVQRPQCGIDWALIAGIGRVESTHANNGAADADGNLLTPILGPALDGSLRGNAVIRDTDGGELDGDANYDRAVGSTQFLPATWNAFAGDGNGDGKADPQNLFDAALTTGNYLCHGNLDLRGAADVAKAVLRYNNSQAYVDDVVGFAQKYAAH